MKRVEILQFFEYAHLPPHLQEISQEFYAIADRLIAKLPDNEERAMMLRKLLEAKDCAVRSRLCRLFYGSEFTITRSLWTSTAQSSASPQG